MTIIQRQKAFIELGLFIKRHLSSQFEAKEIRFHNDLTALIELAYSYNGWFTKTSIESALMGIAEIINEHDLEKFTATHTEPTSPKIVAVIMAGNIPAVGFHDMMCVLLSGHKILIKVSSDDPTLVPFLAGMLIYFEPNFASTINFSEARLTNFEAVIATGSNNSAKHFEYYFSKYPNIIRKNRSSIAILSGKETTEELKELGKDIFYYYGLGCRNVSKLFVPKGYSFNLFYEAIYDFKYVIDNKKYNNNYEYNRAIYLLDLVPFLDNNFLMLKESEDLYAPTSVLFYQFYTNETSVVENITTMSDKLQCVVANFERTDLQTIAFGKTQNPSIFDFADNVNTLEFLKTI